MSQKFNIGDRAVVSNPDEVPAVGVLPGMTGTVVGRIAGHAEPEVYGVRLEGLEGLEGLATTRYLYANELTRIEEES